MSRTKRTQNYPYFGQEFIGAGLSSENPIVVGKSGLVVADNLLVSAAFALRKRGGQELYHTGTFDETASYPASGTPIRGIIEYWRTASLAGNPTSDIFLHQGDKVWSIDDRNTVGVDRSGALSLDTGAVPCYQVFNGKLYFCASVAADGYNYWDGAASAAVAATDPADGPGKYLTHHRGRMIMAGNDDFPFRVYFSDALDPENWSTGTATSLDLVDDGDSNGISGITSFQNRLYVFTRSSIYEITGTTNDDFVVLKVSSGIGCVGQASIAQVPNDVIFCSDRGVHSLKQVASGRQTETTFLSRGIQRLWTELLNTSLYDRVMSVWVEPINSVAITVPSSGQTTNDQVLVYNIEFGTWMLWPDVDARSMCVAMVSNKKNLLLGKEDGRIAFINREARNDFGSGYTGRFKTGVLYPGGDMSVERHFRSITVLAATTTPSQFSIGWNIDGVRTGSKTVELTAGEDLLGTSFVLGQSRLGVGQYLPKSTPIHDSGYGIQIEITAGGTSDIEFYGFILEVEDVDQKFA